MSKVLNCMATIIAALTMETSMLASSDSTMDVDAKYNTYPVYNGTDLGVVVAGGKTAFKLWSPEAQAVRVNLYDTDRNGKAYETHELSRSEHGTWSLTLPDELYGKFYTFNVKVNGRWLAETPGIWAKAAGTNGERAAIIDMTATNPAGWANDKGPELANIVDAVIYEMHHRDFSVSPSSGIVNKGKFIALTEHGTHNPTGEATGIDHLKELGVTHVHILPSYDYNSVDESN